MHIHEEDGLRLQALVATHRREPDLSLRWLMSERNPCERHHACEHALFQRAHREDHDVLKFQFLFALHTAHEIGGGCCKRFCIGNEYGTRLFAMDGIEIILVSARKEALHRAPNLRRIAAVAIENEPASMCASIHSAAICCVCPVGRREMIVCPRS